MSRFSFARIRPGARAVVAALAVAGLVAGCGGADSDNADSTSGAPATRVITGTGLGDVEIPSEPKRVVAGWLVGTLLVDIGVTPVGMFDDLKKNASPAALDKIKDVPSVGGVETSVNLEKIVELEPDLIVTMFRPGMKNIELESLQEIAPTVAIEIVDPSHVWANYAKVADVVGKGADATMKLSDLDKTWADIAISDKDKIAGIGEVVYAEGSAQAGNFQIATNTALVYERLTKSGLTYFSGADPKPARYNQQISLEDLSRLSSANAIFFEADIDGKPTARTQALLDSPVFKALPAAMAGNVFPLRTPYAYTFEAAELQAEDIRGAIEAFEPAA
ncbi:ABC transporter substrate-binding protein [Nocardia mangyaensis]|uniref:ABC transporter substrate-binding protein n=1 Tax=Nocardia mangyaensis TaxID=2213200 RepID=UPI0026748284|nr:ABC transporter substrate-binding protein [Nocardia mangyaensis]MDO3645518.1 ABC transporter substrate-binding protein [Nocardia mangyaensis]